MFRRTLGLVLILLGIAVLLVNGLPPKFAAADDNKCCDPAHAHEPTEPPVSQNACTFNQGTGECDDNGSCATDAWEDAVKGVCRESQHDVCFPDSAVTNVTIHFGHWFCKDFGMQCICSFEVYEGEQAQEDIAEDVDNCTGSAC